MLVPPAPDPVLVRWLTAIPAVRCVSPAFRPWTRATNTFDVVRYVPRPADASEAELWFIYHANRVVAFARYEAV